MIFVRVPRGLNSYSMTNAGDNAQPSSFPPVKLIHVFHSRQSGRITTTRRTSSSTAAINYPDY